MCRVLVISIVVQIVSAWNRCWQQTCTLNATDSIDFAILGDIGGLHVYPYYSHAQLRVRDVLNEMRREKHTKFVVSPGDNIYFTGVDDEFDNRFEQTFSSIYLTEVTSRREPWYFIAGNHDHFGNISGQIAYSRRNLNWVYPSLYYNFSYVAGDGVNRVRADFLMIDTIQLCGNTRDLSNGDFLDMITVEKYEEPPGPADLAAARQQWAWINRTMYESDADYLFVTGHYPVYSGGDHGDTRCLKERLEPLLKQYKATAYFAGHEHTLQHINIDDVNYIVSGAASRVDYDWNHDNELPLDSLKYRYPRNGWNPLSQLGFATGGLAYMQLKKSGSLLEFYSGKGKLLYTATIATPRR